MYLVSDQNGIIGLCDKPNYVKDKNGVYIECREEEAEGLAFNGIVYNISDIAVKYVDGGSITFGNTKDIESNSDGMFDLADLEDENSNAIFELSEMVSELMERFYAQ